MNLEKINKDWITAADFAEAMGISETIAKFVLNNAAMFTMKKKKVDGITYYAGTNTHNTLTKEVKILNIEEMFPDLEVVGRVCCDPTKTLTKGRGYDTVVRKDQWRPTWRGDYGESAYRDMIGVINDNNQYIEVVTERFE